MERIQEEIETYRHKDFMLDITYGKTWYLVFLHSAILGSKQLIFCGSDGPKEQILADVEKYIDDNYNELLYAAGFKQEEQVTL